MHDGIKAGGSDIGRVRGLGSAGSGTHHWWLMRVSSVASLLLGAWFLASLLLLPDFALPTVILWLKQPLVAVPLVLFAVTIVHHLHLGLQELIADYAETPAARVASLMALHGLSLIAVLAAIFSILKIALGA